MEGSVNNLRNLLDTKVVHSREEVQKLAREQQQLSTNLNLTNSALQTVKSSKCRCSDASASSGAPAAAGSAEDLQAVYEEMNKMKTAMRTDVQQLREKLDATSDDLNKAMAVVQLTNENALYNFSASYQENLKAMMTVFEDRSDYLHSNNVTTRCSFA